MLNSDKKHDSIKTLFQKQIK